VNTRAIALTIVFTALAISLTTFGIPAVFLANFYFRFWEIPIVIAFLLLGPKIGVAVAVLRTLAELTLFPSPVGSFLGPLIALGGYSEHAAGDLFSQLAVETQSFTG
jgi:riboflavin transporter FmnP